MRECSEVLCLSSLPYLPSLALLTSLPLQVGPLISKSKIGSPWKCCKLSQWGLGWIPGQKIKFVAF